MNRASMPSKVPQVLVIPMQCRRPAVPAFGRGEGRVPEDAGQAGDLYECVRGMRNEECRCVGRLVNSRQQGHRVLLFSLKLKQALKSETPAISGRSYTKPPR